MSWPHLTWWMWTLVFALGLGLGATGVVLTTVLRHHGRLHTAALRRRSDYGDDPRP